MRVWRCDAHVATSPKPHATNPSPGPRADIVAGLSAPPEGGRPRNGYGVQTLYDRERNVEMCHVSTHRYVEAVAAVHSRWRPCAC